MKLPQVETAQQVDRLSANDHGVDIVGSNVPSPCVDVCKFKHQGHCLGCGMTKKQKKALKRLNGRKTRIEFLEALVEQQAEIGLQANWLLSYRRRCGKKGIACPIEL